MPNLYLVCCLKLPFLIWAYTLPASTPGWLWSLMHANMYYYCYYFHHHHHHHHHHRVWERVSLRNSFGCPETVCRTGWPQAQRSACFCLLLRLMVYTTTAWYQYGFLINSQCGWTYFFFLVPVVCDGYRLSPKSTLKDVPQLLGVKSMTDKLPLTTFMVLPEHHRPETSWRRETRASGDCESTGLAWHLQRHHCIEHNTCEGVTYKESKLSHSLKTVSLICGLWPF